MEILLRYIKEKIFAHQIEVTTEQRAEELEFATEIIRDIYINGQADLSTFSSSLKTIRRDSIGSAREMTHRISFDAERREGSFVDQLSESGVEMILSTIQASPQERYSIRSQGLQEAKHYWEHRLIQPDLPPDEIMLGRRRLIQISIKMEELGKNPQAPNQP